MNRFAKAGRRFARDVSGGIAVAFATILMLILLTIGVAIDYARSANIHTALQNDLDAAVLSGATRSSEIEEIKAAAQFMIGNNWRQRFGVTDQVDVRIEKPDEMTVRGFVSLRVPTTFMALAGRSYMNVAVKSEIELAAENLEVALVLDVTASMDGAKIDAMKAAATGLVDQAYANARSRDHIRFALVPFADYVNVGDINRNAPWLDVPADSEVTQQNCTDNYQPVVGQTNCRMEPYTYDNDGVPVTTSVQVCDYQYGPPESRCFPTTYFTRWYGCAASRDYPLDVRDEQWNVPVPGAMNVACGTPGMELTNDDAALKQRINDLTTFGNTYIPAGLFWGWTVLSPSEPFSTARGYGEKIDGVPVQKVMVLMTDGANTRSADYANKTHSGTDVALANARTQELCQNIKAAGIKMYTIAFDVADVDVKNMLRDHCASSPADFYDAEDAAELQTAFADIGANLAPLRIAR